MFPERSIYAPARVCLQCGFTEYLDIKRGRGTPVRNIRYMNGRPLRRCPQCLIEKPATEEFFYIRRSGNAYNGLSSWCRACELKSKRVRV